MERDRIAYAIGPKRVPVLVEAIDNRLILFLAGSVILALFLLATPDIAFADQSTANQRSISESLSVTTSQGNSGGPVSYHRSISESLAVTANNGKASSSYSRSMSEQASITTANPPPGAPAANQPRLAPTPDAASSNQRIDEGFNLRNLSSSKADPPSRTATGEMLNAEHLFAEPVGSGANAKFDAAASEGEGSASEDHDSSIRYMLAEVGAAQYRASYSYANFVFSMHGLAIIVVAIGKSTVGRQVAGNSNVRVLVAMFGSPSEGSSAKIRILIIIVVLFSIIAVASSASPLFGEAAGDTNKAAIAYRAGATTAEQRIPRYAEWDPATGTWGQEVQLPTAGSPIRFAWLEFSSISSKRVIIVVSNDGSIDSYACESACTDPNSWIDDHDIAVVGLTSGARRPFDIEFEHTSGDLIMVYDNGTSSTTSDLFYMIMPADSNTFAIEGSINDVTEIADVTFSYVRMDSNRTSGSDWIAMIALDQTNDDATAWIWNGTAWGYQEDLVEAGTVAASGARESIGVAYESNSGDVLIVAGEGANIRYNTFTFGSTGWDTSSTSTGWTIGNIGWISLVPDPRSSSDAIFLGATGPSGSDELDSGYWDGSAWSSHSEHDADIDGIGTRIFDFSWSGEDNTGILVWGSANIVGGVAFKRFTAPSTFEPVTPASFTEDGTHLWVQTASNPTTADTLAVLGATIDGGSGQSDIGGIRWSGSTNNATSTGDDGITTTGSTATESFRIAFQLHPTTRDASESLTMTDTVQAIRVRSVNEQFSITDIIVTAITARAITDNMAITDSIITGGIFSRSASDILSMTESAVGTRPAITSDQLLITDAVRAVITAREISDVLAMTESISIAGVKFVSEQAGLQDVLQSRLNGYSAGAVYISNTGDFGLNSVKYRQWDPTTSMWSGEVELPDTGSPVRDARILFSPLNETRIVVSLSDDGTLNLFRCDVSCTEESSWTLVGADFADTGTPGANPFRPFDIAFEQESGVLLIVYDRTVSESNDFYYRTYDGSLSAETGFNYTGAANDNELVVFFRLASNPNSDEIAMVLEDRPNQSTYAFIFDAITGVPSAATQLALSTAIGGQSNDGESIGIAYEPGGERAAAFSGNAVNSMAYATWDGTSWSSVSTVDPNPNIGTNHVRFMIVKPSPSPTNNVIMMCQIDQLASPNLTCAEMQDGVLGTFTEIDNDVDPGITRPFDFVWDQAGNTGTLVWGTTTGEVSYAHWDGTSWGSSSTVSAAGTHPWIIGHEAPTQAETDSALFLTMDSNLDIGSLGLGGSILTLIDVASHTSDSGSTNTEGMSIDWQTAGARQPFRILAEAMAMSDSIVIRVGRPISESLAFTDTIQPASIKPMLDSLSLFESTSTSVVKLVSDQLVVNDSIATTVSRSMTEQLGLSDLPARSIELNRVASEQFGMTDSALVDISRSMTEQTALADTISIAIEKQVIDSLAMTDSPGSMAIPARSMNEQFMVTDSVMASLIFSTPEAFSVSEAIGRSAILSRAVEENLAITDSSGSALAATMSELMGIDEAFADISIEYFRTFSETLIIPADMCTSTTSTSLCDQTESDIIEISDDVVLVLQSPNSVAEEMSLADQLVRGIIASGRSPSESLQTNDNIMILLTRPPPPPPPAITIMPNLMMTSTQDVQDIADPAVAVPVGGLWAIDGLDNESLESILDAMDMPIYNVSIEASSDGADDMTMILPTFHVSAEIGGEASDDAIFLTPTVSDVPEGMGIMIPIDVQASISGNDNNLDALGNMTLSFTPAEDAGNFTMMMATLDNNPEGGPAVPDDAIAFFLDVSFAGNFAGATPANSTYFEELPQITFTIDEEWLVENNIRFNRINLYLLDEATGEWVEISDIDRPASAVNGTYTYTATLPHFSTFAISGTEELTGGGGSEDREFTMSLAESLSVGSVVRLGEQQESSGRIVIKDLDESLAFSITQQKPLRQRVLAVHNVTVAVSVEDVRPSTFGTAVATLYFEITNKGTSPEEIVLSYWYSIGGEREYEHQQTVTVGGGESTIQVVDIPFGSAGVYEIMIQAEARDQTLATTDIVVEVPWLAANMYTLIMIAAAVVAASIAYVAYAMRARLHKL